MTRTQRLTYAPKSPPGNRSGEADDCGEYQDDDADEADICVLGQKDRDCPRKIRAEAELDNNIGHDDGHEDEPNRGQIPFRDIG